MHDSEQNFFGAKVALFLGDQLLVILRDDTPDISWPGHWDMPGGGREGGETPLDTVIRETKEEVGLTLTQDQILAHAIYPAETKPGAVVFFFLAKLPATAVDHIVFGDEGQGWDLMSPEEYAAHPKRIPHFAERMMVLLAKISPFTHP